MGPHRPGAAAPLAALVLATLVLAVAGCARGVSATGGGGVAAPRPEDTGTVDDALASWRNFPVDRHPRPIVLIGPVAVRVAGYTTDAAKLAAGSGRYRVDAPLPTDPAAPTVDLPDGPATLPVIGAAAAVDRMKADAGETKGETVAPLPILGFEFGTAPFPTDRGTVTLPVWRVHTADELGPTVVLAVADSVLARPAANQSTAPGTAYPGGGTATVDAAGRHLRLTVDEAQPHCPGEAIYKREPVVRESAAVVVVAFTATRTGTVPGSGACPLFMKLQPVTYTVDLAAPLGARILVDSRAQPVPVTGG